ncbi:MAG: autotransporter outer membrane beta-barrel domain-containing protein [Verrucomicrobiales bacterium]|jgi:outer membrane autotransporter protein|nr:autotransporter outer membrane beta-barrel domain-containing protein [Verrucomicrobiales bacterium]
MNTPIIKTLTLILTLLPALALTVAAQNLAVTAGTVTETDRTYTAVAGTAALQVAGSTAFYRGTHVTLSSTFDTGNGRHGAYVTNQGSLTLSGGAINTSGSGASGVYIIGSSTATLNEVAINTAGVGAMGVYALNGAKVSGSGWSVRHTGGGWSSNEGRGISATGVGSEITVSDLQIDMAGDFGAGIIAYNGAAVVVDGGRIDTRGRRGDGVLISGTGGVSVELRNVAVSVTGADAVGATVAASLDLGTGTQTLVVAGGSIQSAQGTGITIDWSRPQYDANGQVFYYDLERLAAVTGMVYEVLIKDGATISGTAALQVGSISSGTNSDGQVVPVDKQTVANIEVSGGSSLQGDLNAGDSSAVNLHLSGTSTITGDVFQHDNAAVTVTLDTGATGEGGYHGGNLITGGDSAWTFDKNSHGNYGENHGVWNLGDYEVIFDNMTHTGTVTISVNSDTGAGGSITVTGTADGAGKVHIDTTGDGKADPNQVLPGIVSGDGTEHWQWDPIDWGIDTIVKDGDHFVKKGTSPAGAVLNSAIAVQQSLWFAQQNSLLKRMGELRYGARASRPLADKDVRVPYNNLIDNLWLRSYGQQLNVGSQVAGKAYEQLIYGVDLGTDHKFTLSADSDLYLGVYAGYGRSDIDYRTPGTDGELNSYYGGLYATWLHSSGFYIDATVKAASVDNDLKAPYGNTQLTASYSDVNLGGSLEIGKKFTFKDDWFIEPQFQVNYLHILAEDYTAGPLTISAQDLDALQLRIGSVFGHTLKLANGGALQPYVKISGVETISSGGTLRNGYQSTRANTDGARAEVGGGLIWQLDTTNQLHLDYEASFGDKDDHPWGLTAGYRHQF